MKGIHAQCVAFIVYTALQAFAQRDARGDGERPQRCPGQPDLQVQRPRMGPWNRDLTILRSRDGTTFRESKRFVERGGVPCLTQDPKGRLIGVFQWFPMERREDFDKIGVMASEDTGTNWSAPRAVEFKDLPAEYDRQFDPTLVTLDGGSRTATTSWSSRASFAPTRRWTRRGAAIWQALPDATGPSRCRATRNDHVSPTSPRTACRRLGSHLNI